MDGSWMLAKKPTQWASNSHHMPFRFAKRCNNTHAHGPLEGWRARAAGVYPPRLINRHIRGMRDAADEAHNDSHQEKNHPAIVAAVSSSSSFKSAYAAHASHRSILMEYEQSWQQLLEDRDRVAARKSKKSMFKYADGTSVPVNWVSRDVHKDQYTQEPLPDAQSQEAIVDEPAYVNEHVREWVTSMKHARYPAAKC